MSNCKVIALTNQKGGVGKTTTAVNLGVSLVQQGKKVLLIDADAQANLTMALGYNRPDDIPITLSTVMQNIIDDKTLDASQGIIHHREGVDLLPSNIELSGFEVRLINAMSRERVLKTYVNEVKKNYDYVLIDCMPSLGMITINALAAADSVIIPTQPHYLSAKGLELLLRSVSMVKRQINPKLRIDGILMTMVMPRTNISKEITATVKSAYGRVHLPFHRLSDIFNGRILPTYYEALKKITGVYCLTDTHTGKLYIGSATGEEGVAQRWGNYLDSKHGGNKKLIALYEQKGAEYFEKYFTYTLLEYFGLSYDPIKILEREQYWKRCFDTIKNGYNDQ